MKKSEQIKAIINSIKNDPKEVLIERLEAILHTLSEADINTMYKEFTD